MHDRSVPGCTRSVPGIAKHARRQIATWYAVLCPPTSIHAPCGTCEQRAKRGAQRVTWRQAALEGGRERRGG
eukprot:1322585-Rhodomonas_salina.2